MTTSFETDTPYKARVKPITTPKKTPNVSQSRDTFQTPKYAIDILIPFIPKHVTHVWECAAGGRRIADRLERLGYNVLATDIVETLDRVTPYNFITDTRRTDIVPEYFSIITNPPFSIKDAFVRQCLSYKVPFALLINADYSQQTISWIRAGCEKIVPTSRIAFITPNILKRIHDGEVWKLYCKEMETRVAYDSLEELKVDNPEVYVEIMDRYRNIHNYATIDEASQEMLYKYSSAQFHSMWLTYGFGLGKSETFVDLTSDTRKNNI